MSYTSGSHTVFHHRYHIVWITKYRYKVLEGALRERIRTIIRQVCRELGVQIVSGVLSREHVHMFVEIPPHIAVSDFVRRVKGRSSHRVQMEFPDLRKRYWGRHFWARGYFCTTSGNLTDDVILQYLRDQEPTGVSPQDSPHFHTAPKVSANAGTSASMAANFSINGSSRLSGMVGMRA